MSDNIVDIIIIVVGQVLAIMVGYWLRGYVDKHDRVIWEQAMEKERVRRENNVIGMWPTDEQMALWAEEDEWEVRGDG